MMTSMEADPHASIGTDANGAKGENPRGVVFGVELLRDGSCLGEHPDGHEGAHGVGDVVGAMCEGVEDGGGNLDVLEDGLGLGVEAFGAFVELGHACIGANGSVGVSLHRGHHTSQNLLARRLTLEGWLAFLGLIVDSAAVGLAILALNVCGLSGLFSK